MLARTDCESVREALRMVFMASITVRTPTGAPATSPVSRYSQHQCLNLPTILKVRKCGILWKGLVVAAAEVTVFMLATCEVLAGLIR